MTLQPDGLPDAGIAETPPVSTSGLETTAVSIESEMHSVLSDCYQKAIAAVEANDTSVIDGELGSELAVPLAKLGAVKHAARGALLTLATYKSVCPDQDIRINKSEFVGGFSARAFDTKVTVPFLMRELLPYNVETHWLSQTLSFAGPWERTISMKTQPAAAGALLIDCVNRIQEWQPSDSSNSSDVGQVARAVASRLMVELVRERNRGRVALTRPKNLTIAQTTELLRAHMRGKYVRTGAARLPQLSIYAAYQCIVGSVGRYQNCALEPLARMKAADRKAGTIGDVVISRSGIAIEAVETKFDRPIDEGTVRTAMEKVRTGSVERYFILSTAGVDPSCLDTVARLCLEFRSSNGCEIILNGVLETVGYYLRLINSTGDFLTRYVQLLEDDHDLDYEHRVAWNVTCANQSGAQGPMR